MAVQIESKPVQEVIFKFIFPFSLEHRSQNRLIEQLIGDGFIPFLLNDISLEDQFYGSGRRVNHLNMSRYFLPFTGHVLFPPEHHPEAFRRLSKKLDADAGLVSPFGTHNFRIHSVDMILCPFDTGFLTLRTELTVKEGMTLTDAIEFADRFRSLKDTNPLDRFSHISFEGRTAEEIDDFLLKEIVPQVTPYLAGSENNEGRVFNELPFMMDARMFVSAFYRLSPECEITEADRYRAARIDGIDRSGQPYISASHLPYIQEYCRKVEYNRWAPDTYYMTDEHCFCCLTREVPNAAESPLPLMLGEYYYGLLLNLFHRIVLLKLSNAYSHVQIERKEEHTVALIRDITTFSARYNFVEVVSQNMGRELFMQQRRVYDNEDLFRDVKETLNDLYQYQENRSQKNSHYLLTILTIYAVVSGIYGMNQVIEELKGNIDWSMVHGFSLFEWIALSVALSGLVVAAALTVGILFRWTREFLFRRR